MSGRGGTGVEGVHGLQQGLYFALLLHGESTRLLTNMSMLVARLSFSHAVLVVFILLLALINGTVGSLCS